MDKENTIEKEINEFLKNLFNTSYNENKIFLNNLKNIYILISFLFNNLEKLDIDTKDLRNTTRKDYVEKTQLINDFYKSLGINFKVNDIEKNGTLNILETNEPKDATSQLTYGNNNYIFYERRSFNFKTKEDNIISRNYHKAINVYNNGLLIDSIIWVHEISHYKNQPKEKRHEVNDILTELIAYTEELLYIDYLENIGYEEEAKIFKIMEYQNLYSILNFSYYIIKITLLYYLLGSVNKENYLLLYKEDKSYNKALELFNKGKNDIRLCYHYSIAIISLYNYIEYKKDKKFLENIKRLNKEIMNYNISLENALKIINLKLDRESLNKILDRINIYRNSLLEERKNIK